jgi:hypothetical protein
MDNKHLYKRKVTHTEYPNSKKKVKEGGFTRVLSHVISDNVHTLTKKEIEEKGNFSEANDKFMRGVVAPYVSAYWGGGTCFLMFLALFLPNLARDYVNDPISAFYIISMIVLFLGFIFFLVYYFTMPKKENIFNREDGLLTFDGFMWNDNITMPINNVRFMASSPSAQGLGSYMLEIVRPDKLHSLQLSSLGFTCYEDLSFLLWYMDKNRPLPPGDAFDEYREQDFERRKKEGFPRPLFPSNFDTPEATAKQQAERLRIGGW